MGHNFSAILEKRSTTRSAVLVRRATAAAALLLLMRRVCKYLLVTFSTAPTVPDPDEEGVPDPDEEREPDPNGVAQQLANRGIPLILVLRAYKVGISTRVLREQSTTEEWARTMIVPLTYIMVNGRPEGVSFSEFSSRRYGMQVEQATFHVVHSWTAHAEDLVLGIAKAANHGFREPDDVRDLLREEWHREHRPENLHKRFFVCPFCVNQHTVNGDRQIPVGDPNCEIDKFNLISQIICSQLNADAAMVLIMDIDRIALQRTCCLEELHTALINAFDLRLYGAPNLQPVLVNSMAAGAYDPEVKRRIDARIRANPGVVAFEANIQERLNNYIQEHHRAMERMIFEAAEPQPQAPPPEMAPEVGPFWLHVNMWASADYQAIRDDRVHRRLLAVEIGRAIEAVAEPSMAAVEQMEAFIGEGGSVRIVVRMRERDLQDLSLVWLRLELSEMTGQLELMMIQSFARALHEGVKVKLHGCSLKPVWDMTDYIREDIPLPATLAKSAAEEVSLPVPRATIGADLAVALRAAEEVAFPGPMATSAAEEEATKSPQSTS